MICEVCGTKYIAGGKIKYCNCPCGQKHHVCQVCREAAEALGDGMFLYTTEKKIVQEDFIFILCPRAVRVARILGGF